MSQGKGLGEGLVCPRGRGWCVPGGGSLGFRTSVFLYLQGHTSVCVYVCVCVCVCVCGVCDVCVMCGVVCVYDVWCVWYAAMCGM